VWRSGDEYYGRNNHDWRDGEAKADGERVGKHSLKDAMRATGWGFVKLGASIRRDMGGIVICCWGKVWAARYLRALYNGLHNTIYILRFYHRHRVPCCERKLKSVRHKLSLHNNTNAFCYVALL
jgi:hypothetical protein